MARMAFMRRLRLLDDSQMDSDEVRGRRAAPSGRVASPTAPRRCAAGLLVALCAAATWGGKGPFLHTVASVTSDPAAPSLVVDLSGEGK